MSMRKNLCRTAAAVAALVFVTGSSVPATAGVLADEKTKQKKQARELDDVFKRWLKEDVVYIISPEEKKAFEKLQTDEEREQFIEAFWRRRDPDPDTPDNPTREEHYRRIAYANERFTSGIPGWKTDRGRIYIAWGKPDSIDSHPTGSQYQRPYWQGGGTTTTYAFETWWYRWLPGVGDNIEIEFVDRSGTGEYSIARSPDEKDALLYVGNAGPTEWEQLGLAQRGERPAYGTGYYPYAPNNRSQFDILNTIAELERGPGGNQKFDSLTLLIDDPKIEQNALPFAVRADFYKISERDVATAVTMQIDHKDLAFENKGGIYNATVNVEAIITQLSGQRSGRFQEVISTPSYGESNFTVGQQQVSAFQKMLALAPGHYKIDVIARDVTSGKTGIIHQSFVVPKYEDSKLSMSTLVLASKIGSNDGRGGSSQFTVGRFKVIPNPSNTFKVGHPLGIFMQVYDAQMDQTTLKPAVDIEYVVLKDGAEVARVKGDLSGDMTDLSGSQMAVAQVIPTDALAPGSYTLKVTVTDRVAQKTLTPEVNFTVVQ
jgi:GWxTD domain-containing protein